MKLKIARETKETNNLFVYESAVNEIALHQFMSNCLCMNESYTRSKKVRNPLKQQPLVSPLFHGENGVVVYFRKNMVPPFFSDRYFKWLTQQISS